MSLSSVVSDSAIHLLDRRTEGLDGDEREQLSPFLAEGRKLILYQGYSDGRVSPVATIRFYETRQASTEAMSICKRVRHHRGGDPGPNSFDLLTALEGWVEKDVAGGTGPAGSVTDIAGALVRAIGRF